MLPVLPTMGVGSYASPGWLAGARGQLRRGELGERDIEELFDDALTVCIADQLEAGVDILSDGELRRQRFVFELYRDIEGLEREAPLRRAGVPGYDTAPRYRRAGPLAAPRGLGVVRDFEALRRRVPERPLKVALPGPLTFACFIHAEGSAVADLIDELAALVRGEIDALCAAGAQYIQLDEPGLTNPPFGLPPGEAAEVVNRVLSGAEVRLAVHVCFGNNAGRPFADRRIAPLLPAIEALRCHQLVLEFANREMAELALLTELSRRFEIAAGVVDVKNFHVETPSRVAERIRQCLEMMPADKLAITADCGFSALPRYIAREKMCAMVAGARLVREELAHS